MTSKPFFTLSGDAWQRGYHAAIAGKCNTPPTGEDDSLAWISGYIEGNAAAAERRRVAP